MIKHNESFRGPLTSSFGGFSDGFFLSFLISDCIMIKIVIGLDYSA